MITLTPTSSNRGERSPNLSESRSSVPWKKHERCVCSPRNSMRRLTKSHANNQSTLREDALHSIISCLLASFFLDTSRLKSSSVPNSVIFGLSKMRGARCHRAITIRVTTAVAARSISGRATRGGQLILRLLHNFEGQRACHCTRGSAGKRMTGRHPARGVRDGDRTASGRGLSCRATS